MRIDIIKEATDKIIEAAMGGHDECKVDITEMFVTPQEEKEVVSFMISAMGLLADARNVYPVYPDNGSDPKRIIHIGWSHISWLFDED